MRPPVKWFRLAGRLMSKRGMGKAGFGDLARFHRPHPAVCAQGHDRRRTLCRLEKYDIGDIVGVEGEVFRTHAGEISVKVHSVELLSKSLLPLPEKWHGLKDTDTRYRQRYVDLIVNPEVRDTFVKRSMILKEIRSYLDSKGLSGGGHPRPSPWRSALPPGPLSPTTTPWIWTCTCALKPSSTWKRLIVSGFERVYEVGRIFRNEGMDTKHNPEFTSIELYQAYTDYKGV